MKKDKFKIYKEALEDAKQQYLDDLISKDEYDVLVETASRILNRKVREVLND